MINVTTHKHITWSTFSSFYIISISISIMKGVYFFLPFPVDFVKNVSPRVLAKVKELIFYTNVILNFLVTLS